MSDTATKARSSRRFFQFSLRSVLVLMTLLAVTLAVWQVYVERYRVQREAADAIIAAGGTVRTEPDQPALILALFGKKNFQKVTTVDLPTPDTTALCAGHLRRLKGLEDLTVTGTEFTDKQLRALRSLHGLRQLTLRGTTVTDEAVASLRRTLPKLNVTLEDITIEFKTDLRFGQPSTKPFHRRMLTKRINDLDGRWVRIRGYVFPGFKQFGIKRFVLVRDNMEASFGPGRPLDDSILVEMKQGTSVTYTVRPIDVEGKFAIHETHDPIDGKVVVVFRISEATVH